MGLLFGGNLAAPVEERQAFSDWTPSTGYTAEGSAESTLRLIPLYAATRLIADQLAAAPLRAFVPRADGARQLAPVQPVLLRSAGMFAWKFRAMTSMLLWGNAYGLIVSRAANGTPTQVIWLAPNLVQCSGDAGSPTFTYNGSELPLTDVVHVPAYAVPGRAAGVSPVGAFRVVVETGTSAQQYARDWYDGGGIPAAILRNEMQTLDAEQSQIVKDRLKATLRNGDPFVTGKDWAYETVGAPAADMRFIETMKLTATQIAAIYGVPPEKVGGETGSSLTYSTVELNQINLATEVIRPWAVRLEEAISALFAGTTYVRFNLDSGVRADLLTRYRAHELALKLGLETNDEGRSLEEKAPLTPAEIAQWQSLYGTAAPIAAPTPMTGAPDATK